MLTLGAILSYLPQHVSFLRSKSVAGVSWMWLLLNNLASFCQLINVVVLRWDELLCCRIVSFGGCQSLLLGVYSVAVAFLNLYPMFIFYVYTVWKGDEPIVFPDFVYRCCPPCGRVKTEKWPHKAFFIFSFAFALPMTLTAGVLTSLTGRSTASVSFGVTMGSIASLVTVFMWLPQVRLACSFFACTHRLCLAGSLHVESAQWG